MQKVRSKSKAPIILSILSSASSRPVLISYNQMKKAKKEIQKGLSTEKRFVESTSGEKLRVVIYFWILL